MQATRRTRSTGDSIAHAALDVAVDAATAAATIIRDASNALGAIVWVEKGIADYVTVVDRSAETRIAEVVRGVFPSASLVGEELSPADAGRSGELTFVIDPLDGTTNFLHGYPQYSVSIAALRDGEAIAAVVLNVARGDLFTACIGEGAHLDGERVAVSKISDPARALIGTGFPFKTPDLLEIYSRQFIEVNRRVSGVRRAGSAALDLADVACGRFDGFWELDLAPWDTAAGILLVREAGGVVTDMSGAPARPSQGPVVAGNPEIHSWLLETLDLVSSDSSSTI